MAIHTKVEAGLTDITANKQNIESLKNSDEKVSTVVEVLEDGVEEGIEISSDRPNPAHFGETPRQFDSNGNLTIFWDESIEPPEPDDFESLQEYSLAWQQWETNSNNYSSVKERSGKYSTVTPNTVKAISLWQPYCSLIPLGLKHYETRSWKTLYRGKLLICSTAKSTKAQYQQYLKIGNEVKLPDWDETNFLRGYALVICDLVDCIEMTPGFIAQQSQTEILCGDWQVGRYAWKLENIQSITEPFAVKGKQGLFNVSSTNLGQYLEKSTSNPPPKKSKPKPSDCWYTPPPKKHIRFCLK